MSSAVIGGFVKGLIQAGEIVLVKPVEQCYAGVEFFNERLFIFGVVIGGGSHGHAYFSSPACKSIIYRSESASNLNDSFS